MKALLCLFSILLTLDALSQKIDSASMAHLSPEQKQEAMEYVRQAKNAKTTALVLSITGGAMAFTGTLIWVFDIQESLYTDDSMSDLSAALIIGGYTLALVSIPYFIKIHKKRDKARAIIFGNQGVSVKPGLLIPNTQSVGLGIIFPIGK